MGSCLGRCLASKETKCHVIENSIYFNTESLEFDCLVDKAENSTKKKSKSRGQVRKAEEVALELDEDGWTRSDVRNKHPKVCTTKMSSSGIKSLKACPLNVYALEELQDVTSNSTPHSSIDLEWEPEEYSQQM
ncbi:hypothetical protein J437_LFUL012279 [Ladona fulva]|uniref:Uncharacterized protein n=1 Tax=Ladona fulva TaxID=123851 RepID=A0A8K0KAU7_LADFU|nr:hypothetical protein J437_LFUL012279 [Ladona fulva]